MNESFIRINTPISKEDIADLNVGDKILISGYIFCGRDAVLPRIQRDFDEGKLKEKGIDLEGSVIFHTAVSPAGIGPTSSNKLEIESSIAPLSEAGVRLHLGKGKLKQETVDALNENGSIYAVIPPVTALLGERTISREVAAYEELGMEAFYRLKVKDFPAIVAAAKGQSIYDK
ncbi:MAG: fumarate hydratase C-terminal domain-containing protein [Eubacterium sp.]|nr:fumarate hydratase C-terminal domain-containing protein [Eubacterium sp.]